MSNSEAFRAWQTGAAELWGNDTVCGLFLRAVARRPNDVFLHPIGERSYTYLEAFQVVGQLIESLEGCGIKSGDRVVTYMESSVPLVFLYLSCSLMGVVPAPLSHHFSLRYLKGMIEDLDAKAVLGNEEQVADLLQLEVPTLLFGLVSVEGAALVWSDPVMTVDKAIETVDRCGTACVGTESFMIQPTSGSTGKPKLVVRPHAAFVRYAKYLGEQIGHSERQEVFLAVQAMTHAFALHNLTTALSLGARVAIPRSLDTNAALHDVWEMRPTILAMVPRVLRSFYRQHLHEKASSPMMSLFPPTSRILFSAGGKSDSELLEYCQVQGLDIIEYYGSSEASLVALTPSGAWKPSCAGKPVSDVELKMQEDGEIAIKSPGLFREYLGDKQQTSEAMEDGFYYSGDCGDVTEDGYLRILGRKKDIYNTPEGSNIYPVRIEGLIEKAMWADQVMLMGDQRPYLTAYITLKDPDLESEDEDGYLDPKKHTSVYLRLGQQLERINEVLERVEHIVYFMLFTQRFPESVYLEVGQGKVRRDRKVFTREYAPRIQALYASSLQFMGECRRVPQSDRRLRGKSRRDETVANLVRVHARFPSDLHVHWNTKDDPNQERGVIVDVSRQGVCLETASAPSNIATGHKLSIVGSFQGNRFQIEGQVRWSAKNRLGILVSTKETASETFMLALVKEHSSH